MRAACRLEQLTVDGNFDFLPRDPKHDTAPENALVHEHEWHNRRAQGDGVTERPVVQWTRILRFHGFVDESARFLNILPMSYLESIQLGLIPLSHGGSTVIQNPFPVDPFSTSGTRWKGSKSTSLAGSIHNPRTATMADRAKPENIANMGTGPASGTAPIDLETKQVFEETFGVPAPKTSPCRKRRFSPRKHLVPDIAGRRVNGEPLPYVDIRFTPISEDQSGTPLWRARKSS